MKKGFTLVELLAVIVILSLLALIVGVGVTKITKKAKKDLTQAQELAILDAAEVWTASNIEDIPSQGCVAVSINELVEAGAIGELKMDSFDDIDKDLTVVKICASKSLDDTILYNYKLENLEDTLSCYHKTELEDSVRITDYDPYFCSKDVIIPSKINNKPVTEIGGTAFSGASHIQGSTTIKLTNVIIPNNVTTIGGGAFSKNNLTSVNIPNSVISIGITAFSENNLTSIVIPEGVREIGDYAFSNNQLNYVSISSTVTTIGNTAFYGGSNRISKVDIYATKSVLGSSINSTTFRFSSGCTNVIPDDYSSNTCINWVNG